jgi:hypothetical protein
MPLPTNKFIPHRGIHEDLDCGTRRYLFMINTGDDDTSFNITSLVRGVEFFNDHCIIEYIKDEKDTVWEYFSNLHRNGYGGSYSWDISYLDSEGNVETSWRVVCDQNCHASKRPPSVNHGDTGHTFHRLSMGLSYVNEKGK